MRLSPFALVAAAVAAVMMIGTPLTASAQTRTRGTTPAQSQVDEALRMIIQRDRLPCEYGSGRFIGRNNEGRTLYEVGCRGAPGFLLLDNDPATTINCIANNASVAARRAEDPDAEVGAECTIAENTDVVGSVAAYVQAAGITCAVDQARWVGATNAGDQRYEVGCPGADGFWFDAIAAGGVGNVMPCLQVAAAGGTCQFSPSSEQAAWVASLAAPAGRSCPATTARFVGANGQTGQRYYEVGCADGVGFMVRTNGSNGFESVIECAAAGGIAGGCTLSDTSAVATASAEELQSRLAAANIPCGYIENRAPRQETSGDRRTVVEFACTDRPWGLVAFLPNGSGSPEEIDCLMAEARIGGCALTTRAMMIDGLNILAGNRPTLSSCIVTDYRMVGRLSGAEAGSGELSGDVVELRCENGTGYIAVVRPDRSAIVQSQTCAVSEQRGGTRCEMGA